MSSKNIITVLLFVVLIIGFLFIAFDPRIQIFQITEIDVSHDFEHNLEISPLYFLNGEASLKVEGSLNGNALIHYLGNTIRITPENLPYTIKSQEEWRNVIYMLYIPLTVT